MYGEQFTNPFFGGFTMKSLIGISLMLALALVLMPAGTALAHHGVLGGVDGHPLGWAFDPSDPDPDTNWQPYVMDTTAVNLLNAQSGNLGAGSGNVLWIQNNHQGDAAIGRHHNDNFGRDAFLKFDTAAKTGDVLKGSFRTNNLGAQNGWVLTSDIEAMLDDTSDVGPASSQHRGDAKHHPLTKWTVGFGEILNALDRGIKIEQPESYYASVIVNGAGHGCCGALQAWTNNDTAGETYYRSELETAASHGMDMHKLYPYYTGTAGNGPFRINFEVTVGEAAYTSYTITYENANFDPVGPIFDLGELMITGDHGDAKAQDSSLSTGDPVPMTNVTDTIEGMVWTDMGPKQPQYWIDDIVFSVNGVNVAVDDFEDDPGATNDDDPSGLGLGNYCCGTAGPVGFYPSTDVGTWMPNRYDVHKMTVPEPATLALMGLGGLMFARRRRA